mgnify:CR=1 FL=1
MSRAIPESKNHRNAVLALVRIGRIAQHSLYFPMELSWHYVVMGILYIVAGMAHWFFPRVYRGIMPPWIPAKNALIWISGVAEVSLGLALFIPGLQRIALFGIIAMLATFLPVHVYMVRHASRFPGIPKWLLWVRLPLQLLLMYWAYQYIPQ